VPTPTPRLHYNLVWRNLPVHIRQGFNSLVETLTQPNRRYKLCGPQCRQCTDGPWLGISPPPLHINGYALIPSYFRCKSTKRKNDTHPDTAPRESILPPAEPMCFPTLPQKFRILLCPPPDTLLFWSCSCSIGSKEAFSMTRRLSFTLSPFCVPNYASPLLPFVNPLCAHVSFIYPQGSFSVSVGRQAQIPDGGWGGGGHGCISPGYIMARRWKRCRVTSTTRRASGVDALLPAGPNHSRQWDTKRRVRRARQTTTRHGCKCGQPAVY